MSFLLTDEEKKNYFRMKRKGETFGQERAEKSSEREVEETEVEGLEGIKIVKADNVRIPVNQEISEDNEELSVQTYRAEEKKVQTVVKEKANFLHTPIHTNQEHSYVYLECVFDGTISSAKIFKPVFRNIEEMVNEIEIFKEKNKAFEIEYGLTIFHERPEVTLYGNSQFTKNGEVFLESLKDIQFYGGNQESGKEDISSAIKKGLEVLSQTGGSHAKRVLLVFSDSMPLEEGFDFSNVSPGVRAAICYLNNSDFDGFFNIVDRDDELSENGKNSEGEFRTIKELLVPSRNSKMHELVRDLMYKTSVTI